MRLAIFLLSAAAVFSQSTDSVPALRGVYIHALSGWTPLTMHVLNPIWNSGARDLLSLGRGDAIAVIPGPRSNTQITNQRPSLELRGFPSSSGIYLVRQTPKSDYRELRWKVSRNFEEWLRLRPQDLRPADLTESSPGLVSLSPKENLTPGEYAVVTVLDPGYRGIRVEFDFAVQ